MAKGIYIKQTFEEASKFKENHLTVTRQLYYEREGKNSLDMVSALNGLPFLVKI